MSWHKADILVELCHVRFRGQSGHRQSNSVSGGAAGARAGGHPHRCTPQILPGGLALGPADTPALVRSRSGADRKLYLMVGGGYFANFGEIGRAHV